MTPLAQRLTRSLIGASGEPPFANSGLISREEILECLLKAALFEMSEVSAAIPHLGVSILGTERNAEGQLIFNGEVSSRYAFLPAPITWVELVHEPDIPSIAIRVGYLLQEVGDGLIVGCLFIAKERGAWWGKIAEFVVPHRDGNKAGQARVSPPLVDWLPEHLSNNLQLDVHAILAIINSPKIVRRETRRPHAGLAREIRKAHGQVHLLPWHEIKLQVTPPDLNEDEIMSGQFRFSKGRALHFCRAHLRMWNGRLILVSAHWRGDPALGISRGRYRVQ